MHHIKRIGGAGSSSSSSKSGGGEAPDTLQSDQVARLVDVLSEGEIEGFAGPPLQNIFFDGVPVQNGNGSFNFDGVAIEFTPGLTDQTPLPGFSDVETVVDVNTQVLNGVAIVREVTDPDADRVIVTIQIPALYAVDSSGNVNPTQVPIAIFVQPSGGSYALAVADLIAGKSSSTYQRSYSVPLTGAAPWNIQVQRDYPNSVDVNTQNQTFWASYTIVQDFALIYPDSALVGIQADARLFGTTIPTRTYLLKGIRVALPSNYDPVARTYSGLWDGTFKTAWTDNPAWIFYDLLVNKRYGLGQYVDVSQVDKFGLYQIAQYCDGLVPDGAGGQEPRYRYNGVIAKQEDAIRVLMTMASVFRGMVYWGINGVTATADMPRDPVKIVAPGNVIDGNITYSGPDLRARHTVALVTWWNPALAYVNDIIVVEGDPDDIARFGWRPVSLVAYGCTSRGQAYRMGKWLLDTERNGGDTATWQASWDQADVAPGECVLVSDPAYAGVRHAGRVAAVVLDGGGNCIGITLDAPVTLAGNVSYTIAAALPDGSLGETAITTAAGATTTLAFAPALPQVPLVNAMWVLIGADVQPRQFTVLTRSETAKNLYDITAPFNDPTKYARIEQNVILEPASYTALPSGPIAAPINLTTLEGLTLAGGTTATALCVVSWTAQDVRADTYNLQVKKPGSTSWQSVGLFSGPSGDVLGLLPGSYAFRVRALDSLGSFSPWLEADGIALLGLSQPPAPVEGLLFAYISGRASLTWDEIDDLRPYRYEIRKGPSVAGAMPVGDVAHPPFGTLGDGVYWVAGYVGPSAGPRIYSSAWVSIEVLNSVLVANVVVTHDEQNEGWLGVFSGFAGVSGGSIASSGSNNILGVANVLPVPSILNYGGQASGFYASPYVVNLGKLMACRSTVTWVATGAPPDQNELADPNVLANPDVMGAAMTQYVDVYPVMRIALTADRDLYRETDLYAAAPADLYAAGANWGAWQPWTPDVQNAWLVQFGMVLDTNNPAAMAICSAMKWTVDVEDRVDSYGNLSVPNTGLTLTFTQGGSPAPFIGGPNSDALPHVAPYLANPTAGDTIVVSGVTLSQCVLTVMNGGSAVARTGVGAIVQGY